MNSDPNGLEWTEKGLQAFDELQEIMSKDSLDGGLVLALPDFNRRFILDTDASGYALGAVLSQYQGEVDGTGPLKPIMFISRKLIDAEKNYCTRERECLAIVWAFKRLRRYLWGMPNILVRSDHANLRWLMEAEHTGRLARWVMLLSAYDFTLVHVKGKANVIADGLSRIEAWSPAALIAIMEDPSCLDTEGVLVDHDQMPRGAAYVVGGTSVPTACSASFSEQVEIKAEYFCCPAHKEEDLCDEFEKMEQERSELREDGLHPEAPDRGGYCLSEEKGPISMEEGDDSFIFSSHKALQQQQLLDGEHEELLEYYQDPTKVSENKSIRKKKKVLKMRDGPFWYVGARGAYSADPDK